MSTLDLVVKDETELLSHGDTLAAEVHALVVSDDATYQRAATLARDLVGWIKSGETFFESMKKPAHAAWRAICDRERDVLGPKATLKAVLAERMTAYVTEQDRLRALAERLAREEQDRLEREAQALATAEVARLQKEAEDQRLAEAVQAEAAGDTETAERLLAAPVVVPTVIPEIVFAPPVILPAAPKIAGLSYRDDFAAELLDMKALARAAADGNSTALGMLAFDQPRANQLARALKLGLTVPGVRVVKKRVMVTRGT